MTAARTDRAERDAERRRAYITRTIAQAPPLDGTTIARVRTLLPPLSPEQPTGGAT